jgi:hypothetical protein
MLLLLSVAAVFLGELSLGIADDPQPELACFVGLALPQKLDELPKQFRLVSGHAGNLRFAMGGPIRKATELSQVGKEKGPDHTQV